MLSYEGSIWRPPSEARSLILQATVGCSHNACTFCISYKQKEYRVRGREGILKDLSCLPLSLKDRVTRVFLADGNALAMSTQQILDVLEALRSSLPSVKRIGTYAYAKDVRDKPAKDLEAIRQAGLGIIYLGLETGDDNLLRWCRKGVTTEENIQACRKIRNAGIPLSLTIILGLGGDHGSEKHAKLTAQALNQIQPEYVGALTLMVPQGTPLHEFVERGEFVPMRPMAVLRELKTIIENLELSACVFRTNHASNYLPLGGTLPEDKDRMLLLLDKTIEESDESHLRPSYLRGL
jgi:radical SAM superfamily enzyme YgiQ (UPF0313 family)